MTCAIVRLAPTALALVLVAGPAPAETLRPKFDPDKFEAGQAIDNKYYPLAPGDRVVLTARGVDDEGERFRVKDVLTFVRDRPARRIEGVRVTAQLDKGVRGRAAAVEKTFDYFAQDKRGNVWYLGEDVTNFRYDDDGNLIGKDNESAWRAGRHRAKPGWIMPARQIDRPALLPGDRPARRGARQGRDPRNPRPAACRRQGLPQRAAGARDQPLRAQGPRVQILRPRGSA